MVRGFWVGAVALCIAFVAPGAFAADEPTTVSVISETQDVVVAPDGSSVATVHSELHADNDAGAMRLSQVQVMFNMALQDLQIVDAYTLKPDGTKIPVDMSAIYVRLPPDETNSGEVTDLRVKVIVFPQIAAGDMAIYTARFNNAKAIFPGIYTFGHAYSPAVALKEGRTTITAPKSLNLRAETHDVPFTQEEKGQNVIFSWRYTNTKPHELNAAQVSPMDQIPRFFLSNFKDYAELGRAYDAVVSTKLLVTPKVQALADQITAGTTDQRDMVRKLYEWETTHVRYLALELGQGTIVPHNVDDILTYGYGDCKDHDVLLRALLKAKGIETQSVLLNSSNAYSLTQVPTFIQLDHVITYIPGMKLFLDSSTSATPFGSLPYSEYGKPAVFVAGGNSALSAMPVLQPGIASEYTSNVMKLSATGVLTGKTTTTAQGPSSIILRLIGLAIQALGPEKAASAELEARGYKGATGKLTSGSPMVPGNSFTVSGEFSSAGWAEWLTGTKVAFMPIGLRVLNVAGDGPMGTIASSNDMSPTPCFSVHQSEDDSIEIPANVRFASIPTDAQVTTENIRFTAHWTLNGNTLSVHRDFTSTISQPLCTGAVRRQVAKALLEIAISYLGEIRLIPATGAPALVSKNTAPDLLGPKPVGGQDQIAFNEAITAAKLGDSDRAARLVSAMMASAAPSQTYTTHLAQGLAFLQASRLDAAVAELSEAIKLNPGAGTEPYSARATAYSKLGKTKLAVADLDTALKSAPDDLALRKAHADVLVQMKDFDGAAADYNMIVRAHPNDPELVLARADVRYHADKYEEAAADYRHAAKLGVAEKDVKPGLCNAAARTDQFADAVGTCSWVLKRDAASVASLESRGYAYFRLGKYADALADFSAAVKAAPDAPRYLYEQGVAKVKAGKTAEGKRDIDAATKLDPRISHRVPEKLAL